MAEIRRHALISGGPPGSEFTVGRSRSFVCVVRVEVHDCARKRLSKKWACRVLNVDAISSLDMRFTKHSRPNTNRSFFRETKRQILVKIKVLIEQWRGLHENDVVWRDASE